MGEKPMAGQAQCTYDVLISYIPQDRTWLQSYSLPAFSLPLRASSPRKTLAPMCPASEAHPSTAEAEPARLK